MSLRAPRPPTGTRCRPGCRRRAASGRRARSSSGPPAAGRSSSLGEVDARSRPTLQTAPACAELPSRAVGRLEPRARGSAAPGTRRRPWSGRCPPAQRLLVLEPAGELLAELASRSARRRSVRCAFAGGPASSSASVVEHSAADAPALRACAPLHRARVVGSPAAPEAGRRRCAPRGRSGAAAVSLVGQRRSALDAGLRRPLLEEGPAREEPGLEVLVVRPDPVAVGLAEPLADVELGGEPSTPTLLASPAGSERRVGEAAVVAHVATASRVPLVSAYSATSRVPSPRRTSASAPSARSRPPASSSLHVGRRRPRRGRRSAGAPGRRTRSSRRRRAIAS